MTIPNIDPSLFRANDIRGIAALDESNTDANVNAIPLTSDFAHRLGGALGTLLQHKGQNTLWLCRDARLSSPALHTAFSNGVVNTGCNIIDIGIGPTPLLCHAVATRPAPYQHVDAGVMITASHNPPHHNGFKIIVDGKPFFGESLLELQKRVIEDDFLRGSGKHIHKDHRPDYLDDFSAKVGDLSGLRIVLDAANGAAGPLAISALERVGVEVIPLYCDMDGRFPNHSPDTSDPENLKQLLAAVKHEKVCAGIALDGDGDRMVAATEFGDLLNADDLMRVYSQDLLTHSPGTSIVFDIKTSHHLRPFIEQKGGHAIMTRSGRSFIQAAMFEHNACLAGEFSSHFFFGDTWYGADDGIYAAARLLKISSETGVAFSTFLNQRPQSVATNEIYLPVEESAKFDVVDAFISSCVQDPDLTNNANLVTIDGLRLEYANGWALVRASNTSAAITLRFEADTSAELTSLVDLVRQKLAETSPTLDLSNITHQL